MGAFGIRIHTPLCTLKLDVTYGTGEERHMGRGEERKPGQNGRRNCLRLKLHLPGQVHHAVHGEVHRFRVWLVQGFGWCRREVGLLRGAGNGACAMGRGSFAGPGG